MPIHNLSRQKISAVGECLLYVKWQGGDPTGRIRWDYREETLYPHQHTDDKERKQSGNMHKHEAAALKPVKPKARSNSD